MKRILIAVGCDKYQHMPALGGAENDAVQLFTALANNHGAEYDASCSVLLKSPTLSELQLEISKIDLTEPIETITFCFAGHGTVRSGSFWMCLADSQDGRLSSTAYSLSSLLLFFQEAKPRHANVLIDACESGGVVADIRSSLRAADFGEADTTGITLLAACAKDQYAEERNGSGLGTSAVLECICGDRLVQDLTPYLDLAEIARAIATGKVGQQQPIFWGLNLSGSAPFCGNPHFSHESPLKQSIAAGAKLNLDEVTKRKLRQAYSDVADDWAPAQLRDSLLEILASEESPIEARLGFLSQVSSALILRASGCADPFREIEVRATALSVLLPFVDEPSIAAHCEAECVQVAEGVLARIVEICDAVERDKYALLGKSAHADLFLLPIRLSKLIGWFGVALLVMNSREESGRLNAIASRFSRIVVENYSLSFSSMSDSQAPYIAVAIAGLGAVGARDDAETVLGLLFKSICDSHGAVASLWIEPKDIVNFLLFRAGVETEVQDGVLARPSQLILVLLLASRMFDLDEIFDTSLRDLDRISIYGFVPKSYLDYSKETIGEGKNVTFKIGFDVWTIQGLVDFWSKIERPAPSTKACEHVATVSSLLYPDRVPWFLVGAGKPRPPIGQPNE